ncbi:hypothetical protein ACFQ0K_08450 [Nocardioides caeni]|uniref:Uncharacterized protein n=1 Tax=Nocardioides caeni TaxID=574700 RepID=A0A4S8N355_9ACTN|nr:hypothetical protein [Nocardioides caeni]THV10437.1 hypothetical protein E9934_13960 [Nocardioides caeni]
MSANGEAAPVGDHPKARRRFRKPDMNRAEALNHYQSWSGSTRSQVADEIDRVGGVEFRDNFSQDGYWNSIQVFDASGEFVADLMKTQIRYPLPYAPAGAEDRGSKDGLLVLSLDGVVRAGGARSASRPEPERKHCPNHPGIALPASGVCDDC